MAKYLDPKADLTFKKIFGEHKNLVVSLLNALLPFSEAQKISKKYHLLQPVYSLSLVNDVFENDIEDNGNGSYTIHNADGWSQFASSVYDGTSYSGKTVKLDADIEVSEMVGTNAHKFSGTFDGCGHTLTFNATATSDNCAPFAYIDGATFKRLTVAGVISTGYKFAAGIAAHSYGDCAILSCRSSIAIESSFSGDGTHAGFVAVQEGGTLTITNSLFDGSITGSDTYNCAGFVG